MTDLRSQLQTTLGDAYTIERELGGGGMSRVFVATEESLGRPVVVKVLPSETAGAVSIERFRREIRLAASLQQANIVPVLSAGDAGGVAYYTMPFVKGESLRSHLVAKGALPVAECVAILRDVARALAFAHGEGVVHRDIKPENILLSGGTAVVTDFGIAKAVVASSTQPGSATLTQLGVTLGTPAYMAPEQAVGEQVDHRADIYALGVVAYEMLTGAAPFAGRSAQAMLAAHVMEAPTALAEKCPEAPPGLVALVMQCLSKEQVDRPESASAVLIALDTMTTPQSFAAKRAPGDEQRSLAVLPLSNTSNDPENDYFSDGLTEELINTLGKLSGLRVTARTSAFALKGQGRDVRDVGRLLNAASVLEGSVRRSGARVRVSLQLIDVRTGHQLWSERYDRDLTDLFALQDEIASTVADRLQVELGLGDRRRAARAPLNLEAYDAYLRGRAVLNQGSRESCERAFVHFSRATELDPAFARAHDGIAQSLVWAVIAGADPRQNFSLARHHVTRALELDPFLADAHGTDAYLAFWYEWDWERMERVFLRALELNPGSATARNAYAVCLTNLGRPDDAMDQARRAIELDPLWPHAFQSLGYALAVAGRHTEAIEAANKALELAPAHLPAHFTKTVALLECGDHGGAAAIIEEQLAALPGNTWWLSQLAIVQAHAGHRHWAERALDMLLDCARHATVPGTQLAFAYAAVGDLDRAMEQMQRAVDERDSSIVGIPTFCGFDRLRTDPRFERLIAELKFPRWSLAVAEERKRRFATQVLRAPTRSGEPGKSAASEVKQAKPIVAVLPLANLSSSADDEYFSDGITEDIIAQLSQITSIRVISRTSVMHYKKTDKPLKMIASELGASHLVEGSIRRAGQRLRIVAQLIAAATDEHLWAQTFDREMTDVFAIQSEVAERIAGALHARLSVEQRQRIGRRPTDDQEAYNLYLLARHHANLVTADGLERALEFYQRAVDRDPRFARAWAAIAQTQLFRVAGYYGVRPRDVAPTIVECASRALDLDPEIAEAHSMLGLVAWNIDLDLATARWRHERALALGPSVASVHLLFGSHYLLPTGRLDDAAEEARIALELDPASEYVHVHANWIRYGARRFDEALAGLEAAEAQFGRKVLTLTRGETLIAAGRAGETVASFRELYARIPISWNLGHVAWSLAAAGRRDEALAALQELHEVERREYVWPLGFALTYGHLGEMDLGFAYLEQAYEDRAVWVQWAYAPTFDVFRGDPRFDALVRRIGALRPEALLVQKQAR